MIATRALVKTRVFAISIVIVIAISAFAPFVVSAATHTSGLGIGPSQRNAQRYWYVGAASENGSYLNNGIRGEIKVLPQYTSSFLSFWVSETMSNGLWGQVGYFIFHNSRPVAFYQVWNLTSRFEIASGTLSVSQGFHLFAISLLKATTFEFSVDGVAIGYYNMKTNVSSATVPVYVLSEEGYSSAPFAFEPVAFASIQILKTNHWIGISSALSYGNAWGIFGYMQNQQIEPGDFIVGGNSASLPEGTSLW